MSNIGDLIQAYQDKHGTSDRALATRINVTATLIGRWKKGTFVELPRKDRIEALAGQINVAYPVVLRAFLADVGYLTEESDGDDAQQRAAAPMNVEPLSDRRPRVADDELAGLPNVAHTPKRGRKKE